MATITKELIGRLDLVGSADLGGNVYNLVLPHYFGTSYANSLAIQPIEEVYIICDSTDGAITINLPSSTVFNGVWNTKIYICWVNGGNDVILQPFEGSLDPFIQNDTLNGDSRAYTFQAIYETNYIHLIWDYTWMKLTCPGLLL